MEDNFDEAISNMPFMQHLRPKVYDFNRISSNAIPTVTPFERRADFMSSLPEITDEKERLTDQLRLYTNWVYNPKRSKDTDGEMDFIIGYIRHHIDEIDRLIAQRVAMGLEGRGIKNVSLNNMEDLIRRASKQTVIDALRELGDSPNVKHTKEQLLRQLAEYVEPSQRGGFIQALAMPVAEYFLNNPNSNLNPFNPMNTTAQDFSQGNFKPKKTGLAGMFG